MGNKPVKVGIRLDQSTFESGSELTGRVYLSVSGCGGGYAANGVHLVLMGEEYSEIIFQDKTRHAEVSGADLSTERSTHHIVNLDVSLASFRSGRIPSGQYEYPFQWILPSNLPSSMQCQNGQSSCKIRYTVSARLTQDGLNYSTDHSASQNVIILNRGSGPLDEPTNIVLEPENIPINSCCYSQGSMSLGFDASTTIAAPNSVVDIGITGSNDSVVDVQHLKAEWLETVTWTAGNRTEKMKRTLAKTKIAAGPAWEKISPHAFRRDLGFWNRPGSYNTLAPSYSRIQGRLKLQSDARDTHRGFLIQVTHSLVITAVTPGACCITTPESTILVRVERYEPLQQPIVSTTAPYFASSNQIYTAQGYQVDPPMAVALALPDNWAPQEAEVVVIPTPPAASVVPQERNQPSSASAPDESLVKLGHHSAITVVDLQSSLSAASNPLNSLEGHLANSTTAFTIQNLTPREYVDVVRSVNGEHAQVARRLALAMQQQFQCRHLLAAVWGLPPHIRIAVVTNVAPLASDLALQRGMVERELDSAELLQFKAALKGSMV
jgi:Arrestin (or S-antigen), N-terminal domain